MELCLMRYWSELQNVILNLKLTFHSVQPSTSTVTFVRFCTSNASYLCLLFSSHITPIYIMCSYTNFLLNLGATNAFWAHLHVVV